MTSPPNIEMVYPLAWVPGRPRTARRQPALWRSRGLPITLSEARRRLSVQASSLDEHEGLRLSTNIRFTLAGTRDQNVSRREPDDPGAAFYFTLDGQPHVLACDRWDTVADNIAAIAAHVEALRGQERWGVADLRQAFAGHLVLPAPEQWWQVLGVHADASSVEIDVAWRERMRAAHPDRGGSDTAAARLNAARDQAKRG